VKGIAHFISGVAVASFFPEAVHLAADNLSQILVLGGIFGILPDTLDFKLVRFLERSDVEIDPDPHRPDPQAMAETVAAAIDRARETGPDHIRAIPHRQIGRGPVAAVLDFL